MKVLIMIAALVWLPFTNTPLEKYQLSNNSKVSIAGTSTLHDWTMDSKTVVGSADIDVSENKILSIKEIQVEIPVESLKSGNKTMDKNAYEALKSNKYPKIYFQLSGFDKIKMVNGKSELEVTGNLTIAGKTRPEKILVKYRTDQSGNLFVSGSKDLKMKDYGVTPPEVMFGTIKTGNEILIHFDLHLLQENTI